ncbi:MAG: ABC transporter permease [Armatimonadota bacterium]
MNQEEKLPNNSDDIWPEEKKQLAIQKLWENKELILSLTLRDIRSRYKQSVLGVAWAIVQPLAMLFVYTIVFSKIAQIDTGDIPYPVFSYVALLPWSFFSGSISSGTECLVGNFNLITKIYFPREVFPISNILGKIVDFGIGTIVLVPLLIFYKISITWYALYAIPILIIQLCLSFGIVFLLSSWNLFVRDIRHVLPLAVSVWMYMTPIVYPIDKVPDSLMKFYLINPMVGIMESYRNVVLEGAPPLWGQLGIAAAVSILFLIIGYRNFKRLEPYFAEAI